MRHQIWLRLKEVDTQVFLVCGWNGVGKSRIMRQVMEEVQHQQPPLFDIIAKVRMLGIEALGEKMNMEIWSELPIDREWRRRIEDEARAAQRELQIDHSQRRRVEDESKKATTSTQTGKSIDELWRRRIEDESKEARATRRWEVQRSIAQALGIDMVGAFMPSALQKRIFKALENKRFMLIVEDVWESIDFSKVGVPTPTNGSKLVITARSMQRLPNMEVRRLEEGKDDEELAKEEVWTLFRDESSDIAANLPSYSGLFTMDFVLEFFCYVSLFPPDVGVDGDRLIECLMLEGFMDDLLQVFESDDIEMKIKEMGNALLKELAKRCMLLVTPNPTNTQFAAPSVEELVENYSLEGSSSYHVEMEPHIRDMIDSPKFLVRFDSGSENTFEAKNLEDTERIALSEDSTERLFQGPNVPPPNCPKLSTLFIRGAYYHLQVIPDSFFQFMSRLRILHLSYVRITSLSSSISFLSNLRSLELRGCGDLEALPSFSQVWGKLGVLNLNETPLRKIQETSFQNMQYVRRLHISGASNLIRLSFRGCCSLQIFEIGIQSELEVLDLSGTVIKQYPSEMSQLERLQCLYLSDIKIRCVRFHADRFIYRQVYAQIKQVSVCYENQLEISGGNNFPYNIGDVLFVKESLYLHDNGFIVRVSNMGIDNLYNLRYCLIERCCQLDGIVVGGNKYVNALESLESLWAFELAKLTVVFSGEFGRGSFACLKNIHLHLCPKLVCCFHSSTCLQQLESLEIKFCGRLKVVFEEDGKEDLIAFPSLKTICLLQLPKLQSICSGSLPKLEQLKVKGCSKLEKIPLQVNKNPNAIPVEIRGDKKWWSNINFKGDEGVKQPHIIFKPWRSFY
ncbi:disease resistance protein RPS2 [Cinnamomum micranthum f. kanehirae]|uniref:Disease resistance protein RPS2 n=1 Tax=Cinnamomum micranthum f. kanehirae TaxID=337451 RepID=A0A3S3MCL8_9MAGN|nr:disease resistance protein RPS2 [Cinnamomum micranthum f. kanehirae]